MTSLHDEFTGSGHKTTSEGFAHLISSAIAGLSIMIHWIDDVRRELLYAGESEYPTAEHELLSAFVTDSWCFVGYSEAMLREMRDATGEFITRYQSPGEMVELSIPADGLT